MRHIFLVAFSIALVSLVPRIARAGCEMDSQCKGDRVCEAGVCVAPPAPAPAPQAPATCGADTDCTGDQICEQGVCHAPASTQSAPVSTPAPAAPASPVSTPAPTAAAPAGPTATAAAGAAPPAPASTSETPAPGQMPGAPPVLVKQFGLTGFLSPSAGDSMFLGLQADISMAAPGPRSALLGANFGMGYRNMSMGPIDIAVKSMHAGAWIGFQAKVSSMTTYRAKAGGLMIRDSLDQFGAGGFLAGECKFGKFLFGLDLWITKSADLLIRAGFEL